MPVDLDDVYGKDDKSQTDSAEECGIIMDIAAEKAMERCGNEAVEAQLGQMFGISDFVEIDCEEIMEGELDEREDVSYERVRAACRASELVGEGKTVTQAIKQAWAEIE